MLVLCSLSFPFFYLCNMYIYKKYSHTLHLVMQLVRFGKQDFMVIFAHQ